MKRKTSIVCCLLILVAAAATAWADCAQISFSPAGHDHERSTPAHTRGHHSDSEHRHSHDTAIHCPTLDEFVPTATFSAPKDDGIENVLLALGDRFEPQSASNQFHPVHRPAGPFSLSGIPSYLSLSVLRI